MEKDLIKAIEKLEKMMSSKVIDDYEIHREKESFNNYVVIRATRGEYGSCNVSAWFYEIDDIPEVIEKKLIY